MPQRREGDLDATTRAAVDRYWATFLGFAVEDLERPAVRVVGGRRRPGVMLLRLGRACVVEVTDGRVEATSDAVARLTPDEAFDVEVARSLAGEPVSVHGPSWHGYLANGTNRSGPRADTVDQPASLRSAVERLDPADPRLLDLKVSVDLDEWGEGGFALDLGDIDPATTALYGIATGGTLVAAGNLTEWRGAPGDVGLLTKPDHRGEGLASALAAVMVQDWLPRVGIIRYRALTTNTVSLRIARHLGFIGYGQNMVARLDS